LLRAKNQESSTLLTFGGAYSNHLLAVAAAGNENNFKTIGVVRGEELKTKISKNPTLKLCEYFGMHLYYVDRDLYRKKNSKQFISSLEKIFGEFYLIPEGGTNDLAIEGCKEILTANDEKFDYICCPVGTGGTILGLIESSKINQNILGFSALKGDFLKNFISENTHRTNWDLCTNYHFGGYAKINEDLISFINWFKLTYAIPLDPVYTGKMMYGVFDLIKKNYFKPNTKILVIHTGGLQGIAGMNNVLKQKGLPQILE
jgi:1-aminocyclopropane-1-carboxylate deaminase